LIDVHRWVRSDKKEAAGNVSNGTVELTMNNTEMTDM
jgi:hypothetical protein